MGRRQSKHPCDGHLGERLRQRRKELGLTAKSVAHAAGVSPAYLSQLEHGKQDRPSLEVLGDLASALGLPLMALRRPDDDDTSVVVPPALAAVSAELGLSAETTTMLSGLHIGPHRPTTREGWLLIWLALQAACTESRLEQRQRA